MHERTYLGTLAVVARAGERKVPVLACRFYRTDRGNEPVRDWLKTLSAEARKEIGSDVGQVQWRWPVGKPLIDGFGVGQLEAGS